ncbi:helix-turn-helix transcriptional regulator [Yangia mangrovi]|uniref:Helix-turn-helix transcriptional regulator n=2 Tax=Alloyangia mangrovi TaxID=1779329 RepID=A0ABT2KJG4_9RHOB|nr:XRE family transcriptional regulator [Alloyangia mangrovi]MCA0942457.1 XRE family transcriptional regulator [Alloyangia pacifica]MCA0947755.1 XRE family transcriptional regulator [Alloyangia pacifica]MCT4370394.1 helix-turn-helix transcriptional regulator [Alloyangia mangrovi]
MDELASPTRPAPSGDLTARLARRLAALRGEAGLTLDQLAERSGISRAALSRFEKGETSPTAEVLGKLCLAYGLSMSRLMAMVEEGFTARVPAAEQPEWRDEATGFTRRVISPAATGLAAEMLQCVLQPGAEIAYDASPVPGLEHHLHLLSGKLLVEVEGVAHDLAAGDTLRYRLEGPTRFAALSKKKPALYVLVLVTP